MSKIAFVFPGQGAQTVGMGRDAYEQYEAARCKFEQADAVLDFALSDLIFNGPEDQLKITYHTQPALLTASMALYEVIKQHSDVKPDFVAGHSLGEYSALAAAGVITFEDAVKTVRSRGLFMDQAVPNGQGAMAAVLGADRDTLKQFCEQISSEIGVVELANVNCPGQIVVSGSSEGVAAVVEKGKEVGAKRVKLLEVSGPFHSSLMKPAAEQLADVLETLNLQSTSIPVIANVTARPVQDAEEIKRLLVEQVYSPVLWEDSVMWMLDQGVETFVEIGSGTVLAGLIKKCNRAAKVISVQSVEAAETLNDSLSIHSV